MVLRKSWENCSGQVVVLRMDIYTWKNLHLHNLTFVPHGRLEGSIPGQFSVGSSGSVDSREQVHLQKMTSQNMDEWDIVWMRLLDTSITA